MLEEEIENRIKPFKKTWHTIEYQMQSMSLHRRSAIAHLIELLDSNDPHSRAWTTLSGTHMSTGVWEAVRHFNKEPELTKEQGEVVAFSVVLKKVPKMSSHQHKLLQEAAGLEIESMF